MDWLDGFLEKLSNLETGGFTAQLIQFLIWAIVILFLTWIIRKTLTRTISDNATLYRTKKVVRLLSYILVVLLAIITFTSKVQYFTIAIGLISAGLAFALQEIILSVAGWIAIWTANLYKPGDRIELNNVKGDVIDISITKTTLMEMGEWVSSDNYSGRIVQISNAFVFKGPMRNYSTDFPFVWDEIILKVRYGSDLKLAEQIILESATTNLSDYAQFANQYWQKMVRKYLIENANVQPSVTLNLTDNWAEFNLRYVVDYKRRRITKDLLFKQIWEGIEKSAGKVQLASETIEIQGWPGPKTS